MATHTPFQSRFLRDFAVVEERVNNKSWFPHRQQLSKLLRALNEEFRAGLPDKIAKVDHRANGFMKVQRHWAVLLFCVYWNRARSDNLRLFPLFDRNIVARISIVQQVVTHEEKGPIHRFTFYGGEDLALEPRLNGRNVCFSGHLLDRFSERVPNSVGSDLTNFLTMCFGSPVVIMRLQDSEAAVFDYRESIIALPIRESDERREYFFPTCLTLNELSKLEPHFPPVAFPFHFDPEYEPQTVRNWDPVELTLDLYQKWQARIALAPASEIDLNSKMTWADLGHDITARLRAQGHAEGSRLVLFENIHGTIVIPLLPEEPEPRYVETEEMKKLIFPSLSLAEIEQHNQKVKDANPLWYSGSRCCLCNRVK